MTDKHAKRGGARQNAGRRQLWETPECCWIVDHVRKIAAAKFVTKQNKKAISQHPEFEEVRDDQRRLRAKTPPGSVPDPEILGDIHYNFAPSPDEKEALASYDGPGLPRLLPAVTLSPSEWGRVYADTSKAAGKHFNHPVSHRQVKRCVEAWLKFEKSLQ